MASQLPTSMSLLTSPTDFRGIPMSRLLAALYGDMNATPSTQYATPVPHSTSSSFRKGVDPRNRPRPRATTQTTAQTTQPAPAPTPTTATSSLVDPVSTRGLKGAALQNAYAQNRAAMRARRQQEARDLEATKATNRAKPTPESAIALAKALRNPDRSYDAAESARLAPRTIGAPSSVYAAPPALPRDRRSPEKKLSDELAKLRGMSPNAGAPITPEEIARSRAELDQQSESMLADMEARQAAQGLEARYREAAIQSKYGTDEERLAERNRLSAEQEVINRNAARAQMAVNQIHSQQNAARRAEALVPDPLNQLNDPQLVLNALSRAFSPEGASALYRTGVDGISRVLGGLESVVDPLPVMFGFTDPEAEYSDDVVNEVAQTININKRNTELNERRVAEERARYQNQLKEEARLRALREGPRTGRSSVVPSESFVNPPMRLNFDNLPPAMPMPPSTYRRDLSSGGNIGAAPPMPPGVLESLMKILPDSFRDPRSMYYFPGKYY